MAAVLAVGALLGYPGSSGRLSPFAGACAGQSLTPAESTSGAKPAYGDELNKGRLLAPGAPDQTATAPGSPAGTEEVIFFVVRLPAGAILEIDGEKTKSTGEERTFKTPPLPVGGRYHYTLKATSQGKEVTRQIKLRHGRENSIDLRPAFRAGREEQPGSRPTNIIFVICDQETYHLTARNDYKLPARQALARRGVTFRNHYIASAMCTPSRAAFLTGQPPQVNGVFDQMEYSYQNSLSRDRPNMGSVLKGLGYQTAYLGKFEMDKPLLADRPTENYSAAAKPYGFDEFSATGDTPSGPRDGYTNDYSIAGNGVRWLRANAPKSREGGKPFFLVLSFLNPHDIMYANANVPGMAAVQKAFSPAFMPPLPANALYERQWEFTLAPSLGESLTAKGMPAALEEYHKGWSGVLGLVPNDRKDMWRIFYNYYLNCIRDNDRSLQLIVDAMDDMDLWKDTAIVFTADHGEMAGAHGGLKGKGPFCYEANAHVPLIIAHPGAKPGTTCSALTSHLDLLPTFVGMTGLPEEKRSAAVKGLPGHNFTPLLGNPEDAAIDANRKGVLFNYVGISTVEGKYLEAVMLSVAEHKKAPPLTEINLDKRGFLSFTFDGRYKFARYYAPNAFNAPKTLEQIFKYNDVQLFDLKDDPDEVRNLALDREKNGGTILRLNALLNDLMAREVGVNDGKFLPEVVRPKKPPMTFEEP
jgi:arylsulfatase